MSVNLPNLAINYQPEKPGFQPQALASNAGLNQNSTNAGGDKFISSAADSSKTSNTKNFLKNNWPKLLAGAAVLAGGVAIAVKFIKKPVIAVKEVEEVVDEATTKLREDITKIYDNIFEDVTKGLKEHNMNLPKPDLIFKSKEGKLGSYNALNNVLNINLNYLKNNCIARDKNGNLLSFELTDINGKNKRITAFFNKDNQVVLKEIEKMGAEIKPVTDDLIKAQAVEVIAHETRHYVQNMMMLNDSSMGPDFIAKMYGKSFFDEAGILKGSKNKVNIKDVSDKDLIKLVKANCPFLKNYKPAKGLKGVIAINPKTGNPDHIYTSIHFKEGLERYFTVDGSKNMKKGEYYANPMEVDANLYAADYLKNNLKNLVQDCPDDIVNSLFISAHKNGSNGIKQAKEFGFSPVVNEKDIGKN